MNQHALLPLALLGLLSAGCMTNVLPSQLPTEHSSDHAREPQLTKLVGEGRLSHPPQYIELTVTVQSLCHPTPLGASQATDATAAKVMKLLRGKLDTSNEQDGVLSDGGYSQPYQRYVRTGVTVCRGTFQKTSTIVMKTSRLATFSKDYLDIQQLVLSDALAKPDEKSIEAPVTFASIGVPTPRLYHQTREALEQQALADAVANARDKFSVSAKVACGKPDYGIMKFVEVSADAGRPIAYGANGGSRRSGGADGPIELDVIWVNKLLDVYFTIAPNSCRG